MPLLSTILAVAALGAQTIVPNDAPTELPVVDPNGGRADHCEVAINDQRDLLVVWHCEFDPVQQPGALRVEGLYAAWDPVAEVWRASQPIVLGEPMAAGERCQKPDVIAIEDNDFAVVWARMRQGQLDTVDAVLVRDATPTQPNPVIERPGVGQGYPLDDQIEGDLLGILPTLVWTPLMGNDEFAVLYNHRANWDKQANEIDMDIRWALASPQTGGGWQAQAQTLVSGIPIDGQLISAIQGSRGIADALFTEGDRFCLAWEQCVHQGAPVYESSIQVAWCDFVPGQTPRVLASHELTDGVGEFADLLRRPALTRSALEDGAEVQLSYYQARLRVNQGQVQGGDPELRVWEIDLAAGELTPLPVPPPSDVRRLLPVPLTTLNTRGVFFSWHDSSTPVQHRGEIYWTRNEVGRRAGEFLEPCEGQRHSLALLERTDRLDTLPIAFQRIPSGGSCFRIYLEVRLGNF